PVASEPAHDLPRSDRRPRRLRRRHDAGGPRGRAGASSRRLRPVPRLPRHVSHDASAGLGRRRRRDAGRDEDAPASISRGAAAAVTGAAVAGLGLIAACAAIARLSNLVESAAAFLVWFSVAFLCYALASWRLAAARGPRALALVIVVGVIARLTLVSAAPTLSTDAYRYVWDARVAQAGISPYAFAPADRELERLRDAEIFPRLNHPTWRTLYPPATQAFFHTVYRLMPDSVLAMKLAVALLELVGVATVLGLLRAAGRPLSHAVIYVWNPLVLVEVWGTGHVDGVLVPLVAGAMWASVRGRTPLGERAVLLVGGLLVLAPNIFPWYAVSLATVLAWAPSLPWIAFTGTVMFAYTFFLQDPWQIPGWARTVEFTPLALGGG